MVELGCPKQGTVLPNHQSTEWNLEHWCWSGTLNHWTL